MKELLAHHFTAANVKLELEKLLHNADYRSQMLENYREIRQISGSPGAAAKAAESIVKRLEISM